MPTYVYRREDGTTFETVQRITEPALTTDPETGQRVERVIFGAGLAFKGSGFYLTDYARKPDAGKKEAVKAEKAATSETKDTATPKAEARAEAKPETTSAPAKAASAPTAPEKKA